jgi:hypothetical protein
MITINLKYLDPKRHGDLSELEILGHYVATIDEQNLWYEDDLTREFKQNLSPHDWQTEEEYVALTRFLKNG